MPNSTAVTLTRSEKGYHIFLTQLERGNLTFPLASVADIRNAYYNDGASLRSLSEEYGVSKQMISNIVNGRCYAFVDSKGEVTDKRFTPPKDKVTGHKRACYDKKRQPGTEFAVGTAS